MFDSKCRFHNYEKYIKEEKATLIIDKFNKRDLHATDSPLQNNMSMQWIKRHITTSYACVERRYRTRDKL